MNTIINELNYYTHNINHTIVNRHYHTGYELIYITNGCVKLEIDGVIHKVSAPSIIMLNPFEWHKIIASDSKQYHRYTLVLDAEQLEREIHPYLVAMIKCRPSGFSHIISLADCEEEYINNIFSLLIKEYKKEYHYQERLIFNEICSLLILMYRNSEIKYNKQDTLMINIQKYFDENYASIQNIHEVTDIFHISDGHLSRCFKEYSGYSPVEYLLNTRLYHAQLLLLNTSDSITEICESVGFNDINNFIRQFKKKYGIPPLTFRKNK